MPKVTEEHLARRRRQILDAAAACFERKGLPATSMQDILTESGLSAGAVYRYFPSKTAIVEAIMTSTVGDLHTRLAALVDADPLPPLDDVITGFAVHLEEMLAAGGPVRLAPQAWALALHDPELRKHVQETMGLMVAAWVRYVRRLVDTGALPPGTDAAAVGRTIFGILPGFLLQTLILENVSAGDLRTGIRALLRPHLTAPTA
ncbi:TetR/AcrR family transcriptional regulator [Actinomadura flavalba]|uniref:TetR/AcrR family transcriptional regulator n=1 Tax=Actinomadura flavalba TaxID=1120938 RepID=UPI0003701B50|nr:TetR/AcrR family transcriptional regulator [Actinomadura flavalba]